MTQGTKTTEFLKKYGLSTNSIDTVACIKTFVDKMSQGLTTEGSSLAMIPTYIGKSCKPPKDRIITVIDAGGTNLRIANVHFDSESITSISDLVKYPMLGTQCKMDKQSFFDALASYVLPILGDNDSIGFCFSYAVAMEPSGDGRLIHFCKEVDVEGVEGELIGQNLIDSLRKQGYTGKGNIVILNDTVTTLLSGMAAKSNRRYSSYLGSILGTGLNTCYIEQTEAIRNLDKSTFADTGMVINCETGAYAEIPRGELDFKFDATTLNKGSVLMEKCISGAYLGGLCLTVIKQAANEGLLSNYAKEILDQTPELETYQISELLQGAPSMDNPIIKCLENSDDADTILTLVDAVVERAALYAAISWTAVVLKSGKGLDANSPVCITVEGTTFYKLHSLKDRVVKYLDQLMTNHYKRYYVLSCIDDATLIGSAIAGAMF